VIVLDTTILVYALGDQHPLRSPCRDVIAAIGQGTVAATTTIEVIQEFTHVRARRRGRAEAVSRARDYVGLLTPLLQPSESDLAAAMRLFLEHDTLGMFDAVLAAVTLSSSHTTGLMSADKAFASIDDLYYLIPGIDPDV